MIERLLLAVDDSPDALAATRLAIELAARLGAQLRAVHVTADHALDAALEAATGRTASATDRDRAGGAVLQRVREMAAARGVSADTELLAGEVGAAVLAAARSWPAELVVIGTASHPKSGQPYVGAQTRHVLEFTDVPVLVVPRRAR